jgi:betaine lipid synthase
LSHTQYTLLLDLLPIKLRKRFINVACCNELQNFPDLKAMAKVTPRTEISGAHEQGVFVKTGGKLTKSSLTPYMIALAIAMPLIFDWIPKESSLGALKETLLRSFTALRYLPSGVQGLGLVTIIVSGYFLMTQGRPYVLFAYNCFVKPFLKKTSAGIDANEHRDRLEEFYNGQAEVYDLTRKRLLRGRSTMLKLCAAQLRQVYPCSATFKGDRFGLKSSEDGTLSPPLSPTFLSCAGKKYAWIDVGGGTGQNIEKMNQYFPISNFDRVYLVDITPSLCEVARKRFQTLGWANVRVICCDASEFEIPKEDGEIDIGLITMSYSLTMIETYYPIIDRLSQILAPTGIFGVADFYVSNKRSMDPTRQLNWIMRYC